MKWKLEIGKWKTLLITSAMLLSGGIAMAQTQTSGVTIKGNVYGGGKLSIVRNDTVHQGNAVVPVIDSTTVTIFDGIIQGSVYGGGLGDTLFLSDTAGLVEGNTKVEMKGGTVERSIYGGGQLGSVGKFTAFDMVKYPKITDASEDSITVYVPNARLAGTGVSKVLISGGHVGGDGSLMPALGSDPDDDDRGYVFAGSQGAADSINYYRAIAMGVTDSTYVRISSSALITASVYGGAENGLVLGNTRVDIDGGQIGTGLIRKYMDGDELVGVWDGRYDEQLWQKAIDTIKSGIPEKINAIASRFHECDHFDYGDGQGNYSVYDDLYGQHYIQYPDSVYLPANTCDTAGYNGHTYFGNVFGGGSGFYPIAPGIWRRNAGQVRGNTTVNITGGHILTNVYGGNEMTDVKGNCTVNMSGGTLGVPRTLAQIAAHPVTCYLFGAGKGDQRVLFNTWTNVTNVEVNVTGGHIFGSVFGGGEDGHVMGDVNMTIDKTSTSNPFIGTWGYSYVDGNVFGGGRGFAGDALTAGNVGGNINIDIKDGTMLGSIYGGGRMASVGPQLKPDNDPLYGVIQGGPDHGIVTIDITGGTIGNDYESKWHYKEHTYGGNVFGGSMGRLTLLDGNNNYIWPNLAKVKATVINVNGEDVIIKGNVYGGCEYGTVTDSTWITITNGTIWRDVYAGGRGDTTSVMSGELRIYKDPDAAHNNQPWVDTVYVSPMQWAGRVEGNTNLLVEGGWVKKSVYGGGEMGTVGTLSKLPVEHPAPLDYNVPESGHPCHLSWPFEFDYVPTTGLASVTVKGGRIGLTGKDYMGPWNEDGNPIYYDSIFENNQFVGFSNDPTEYVLQKTGDNYAQYYLDSIRLKNAKVDNGDVYGGGRGMAGDRFKMAHLCNVCNTKVTFQIENSGVDPDNYKPKYPYPDNHDIEYVIDFYEKYSDWNVDNVNYASRSCIPGSLYGGGENGHVHDSTQVILKDGLIGHALYGGGKGSDTYHTTLNAYDPVTFDPIMVGGVQLTKDTTITSLTAGKVYGNTYVTVDGGCVVRNVYGGGNRASVGKANYADGYVAGVGGYYYNGYGEKWDNDGGYRPEGGDFIPWPEDNFRYIDSIQTYTGHTYVNINGGQIGTANGKKDDLPTGNVFGGSRGETAPDVPQSLVPRFLYCPEFFLGYVNHTHVNIGKAESNSTGSSGGDEPATDGGRATQTEPRLYGSVYGGGQDGHVRKHTNVIVNAGEIGNEYYSRDSAILLVKTADVNNIQWYARGNVFGAGSGIGQHKDASGNKKYNYSSGSVTEHTNVTINGGKIHRNVYGGGMLATVGPPKLPGAAELTSQVSRNKVTINSTVGVPSDAIGSVDTLDLEHPNGVYDSIVNWSYGGHVFGGSRGMIASGVSLTRFSTSAYTDVKLQLDAFVPGNVYGGGELGCVVECTNVEMTDGVVGTIDYVHKKATAATAALDSVVHTSGGRVFGGGEGIDTNRGAALVYDSTCVTIRGGHVLRNIYGGGELASVGVRDTVPFTIVPNVLDTIDFTPLQGKASHADSTGLAIVNFYGGQVGPAPMFASKHNSAAGANDSINVPIGLNGVDGYVFGGGRGYGNDSTNRFMEFGDVNNTRVTVNIPHDANTNTNRIWGSIFGGSEDGHVLGNAEVYFISGLMGTDGTTSYDGNIFGGGRNYSRKNHTAGRVRGNINVEMSGGQLYGSIFGGGRLGATGVSSIGLIVPDKDGKKYGSIAVKVKGGIVGNNNKTGNPNDPDETVIETFTKYSMGDVFGGGKGTMEGIDVQGYDRTSTLLLSISKNTDVEISQQYDSVPTIIYGSVFGGGEVANVGQCSWGYDNSFNPPHIINVTPMQGTGLAKVTIKGGRIGLDRMRMRYDLSDEDDNYNLKYNVDVGHVFGGGEGVIADPEPNDSPEHPDHDNPLVNGGVYRLADAMAITFNTEVTITNDTIGPDKIRRPWVKGSVYGGAMSGHVWWDTDVKIKGGQIGSGYYPADAVAGTPAKDSLYVDDQFFNPLVYFDPLQNNNNYVHPYDVAASDTLAECYSWPYDPATNRPFDPVKLKADATYTPSDGKSWFGNVFGGGSGYYPFIKKVGNDTVSVWNPTAGSVRGNTNVSITGGHILTSVYGGNELTSVGQYLKDKDGNDSLVDGVATVKMYGGTLGVPRNFEQIARHPVTCYLFGAGKGDPRTIFNTETNVVEANVDVAGGIVYGSIFGGGEDGHVVGDAFVTVRDSVQTSNGTGTGKAEDPNATITTVLSRPIIGTTGRSYVDGNVFGGGRGFASLALTAGVVGGNVDVNISGGTMLGSVYGGGRLASVGTYLVEATDSNYGKMQEDANNNTHGHITVNISGGTIGNDYESVFFPDYSHHPTGGNVFTGAMGRLTNLSNTAMDSLWPRQAMVKSTQLTVSDSALIKGNLYGGGEFGTVHKDANILVSGGTVMRDVYGGGYGSDSVNLVEGFACTPLQYAGRVGGNTKITMTGGWIKKSVYGGGEIATIGIISDSTIHDTTLVTHPERFHPFNLSWPYKMTYASGGIDTIIVTGGRIGITGSDYMGSYAYFNDNTLKPCYYDEQGNPVQYDTESPEYDDAEIDNGDIYGGGKGFAADRYLEAHVANVRRTVINIDYTTCNVTPADYKKTANVDANHGCITGAVYGGAENGHVIDSTKIILKNGLVGHNIYGGGKGKGLYDAKLYRYDPVTLQQIPNSEHDTTIYSITAGKVYGNTHVIMEGGYVVRNIFGGGNLASIGKGNYAGGVGDYSTTGYGEKVTNAEHWADTANSGHAYVTVKAGQLGYLDREKAHKVLKDGLPYGSVYGGARGAATPDVPRTLTPRYRYCPEDFLGYVNKTHVTIGKLNDQTAGPRLYGSVYGGGQDGHVRWDTYVNVNSGEIGADYGATAEAEQISKYDSIQKNPNSDHWLNRGNVYGAGSGIGQYETYVPNVQHPDVNDTIKHYSYTSGSVTQFTHVEIKGGIIHNSVYGGGNLASVGPPRIFQQVDCSSDKTGTNVTIGGNAKIGKNTDQATDYGGRVFGASRGIASDSIVPVVFGTGANAVTLNKPKYRSYALCSYTTVTVKDTAYIYGSVFGGGENGQVGSYHENSSTGVEDGQNIHNTLVNILGGTVLHTVYGGGQGVWGETKADGRSVYADTIAGRVMGSTEVNLIGDTLANGTPIGTIGSPTVNGTIYGGSRRANIWGNTQVNVGIEESSGNPKGFITIHGSVFGANKTMGTPYGNAKVDVYRTAHNELNAYPNPAPETPEALTSLPHDASRFAIKQVFGGGDQSNYIPRTGSNATVHVHYCEENTIEDLYGGSNAADIGPSRIDSTSVNTNLIVDGGRMHRVFGGGKGNHEVTPTISADIHGTANTTIYGGLIDELYGGGNSLGEIDEINLLVVEESNDCREIIGEIFGGGNDAPIEGDVITTLSCGEGNYGTFYGGAHNADIYGNVYLNVMGGSYDYIFGGSKGRVDNPSDILDYTQHYRDSINAYYTQLVGHDTIAIAPGDGGNVTVNIFGGKIRKAAFGGSDVNGKIANKITVNVFEAGDCNLELEDLYGAGRSTPYHPDSLHQNWPEVNLIHGTVLGNVYGGAQGDTATVYGNPVVNVGYYEALMGNAQGGLVKTLIDTIQHHATWTPLTDYVIHVGGSVNDEEEKGNVFGGGKLAQVEGNTSVYMRKGVVDGCIYGGGAGADSLETYGLVKDSTLVEMTGGQVKLSIYGGGQLASVGTIQSYDTLVYVRDEGDPTKNDTAFVPKSFKPGTGLAKVLVSGGLVGSTRAMMPSTTNPEDDKYGWIFCGSEGLADSISSYKANALGVVDSTYLRISDSALVTASAYGGCENGLVLRNTRVDIAGGQIGIGHYQVLNGQTGQYEDRFDGRYSDSLWKVAIDSIRNGTFTDAVAQELNFHECDAWPYGFNHDNNPNTPDVYWVYDIYVDSTLSTGEVYKPDYSSSSGGSNGQSFFGNVFGGGSGYYPIAPGVWRRSAGQVNGNTTVNITGGHILTNVYGGNETTNVWGNSTINMSGGTVGVPRTRQQMIDHPVTCYIFGGGKGDPRENFVNYGHSSNTEVNVSGGTVFGSIFGGAEDGHIHNDAVVNVTDTALIGTLGTSSVDGNIFGGGRNYAVFIDQAGRVEGNVTVNMNGNAHILGNIFGGGRSGSVGMDDDGNMITDDPEHSGNIYVNVSGGIVGNPLFDTITSGTIFGGGMGRNDLDTLRAGKAMNTYVTVSDSARVLANVFGGSAYGAVHNNTNIVVKGGEIGVMTPMRNKANTADSISEYGLPVYNRREGNVYGGGRGFAPVLPANVPVYAYANYVNYGIVLGDTYVTIRDSIAQDTTIVPQIHGIVFGGGDVASVGIYSTGQHAGLTSGGATYVNVKGGHIGPMDGSGMNAYVFGGSQGVSGDTKGYYKYHGTVGCTNITIDSLARIDGSVLGGGAEGHVWDSTTIEIKGGTIGTLGYALGDGSVFGGGGNMTESNMTAGRVGGKTHIIISEADKKYPTLIKGNVYGGGYAGMVGLNGNGVVATSDLDKHGRTLIEITGGEVGVDSLVTTQFVGNVFGGGKGSQFDNDTLGNVLNSEVLIAGDARVYANVFGGGEKATVGWFYSTPNQYQANANTGVAMVTVSGGFVGTDTITQQTGREGNVFGGGLGEPGVANLLFANVDSTAVFISDSAMVYNSVYGGGDNGHVIRNTKVDMSGGTVGRRLTLVERMVDSRNNHPMIYTGTVYGGGRGSKMVEEVSAATGHDTTYYSPITGVVYGNTNVNISGGVVRHNVYGGGALASVGTYTYVHDTITDVASGTGTAKVTITGTDKTHRALIGPTKEDLTEPSQAEFTAFFHESLTSDNLHQYIDTAFRYLGGNEGSVYGSSRGLAEPKYDHLAYTDSTSVTITGYAQVTSGVFGGGENGRVYHNTNVLISGGTIGGMPLHGDTITENGADYTVYIDTITGNEYKGVEVRLGKYDGELTEDEYGVGRRVFRGSVFAGGRGTDTYIVQGGVPLPMFNPVAGRVFGNSKVSVTDGIIYSNVHGGGTISSVGDYIYNANDSVVGIRSGGIAVVDISGGQIGTDGNNNGSVYGGGLGVAMEPGNQLIQRSFVDSTNVTVRGTAKVMNSVYGGSPSGHVLGNTMVTIQNNAQIGYATNGKVHGGWHSNVYGGGGGGDRYVSNLTTGATHLSITSGRVYGNSQVDIEGGQVFHNVYGGGAIASVGTYILTGNVYPLKPGTGTATVNVTGGIIGVDGNNNGMVFGSGRGLIDRPDAYMDTLSYTANTFVNIGKESTMGSFEGAKVNGSVYGGGENGHVFETANVTVYNGTIGCTATEFSDMDSITIADRFPYRGNVYGAGCGTDIYDNTDSISFNPKSGWVQGNTVVNIKGGYISRNVYGGGAMASVGMFTCTERHTGDTLSWPCVLDYTSGGKAVVNVTGGHIGTFDAPMLASGDVYGSSRGLATNRYKMARFANVDTAYVTVNFTPPAIEDINDETPNLIVGCLYGSGENGHVYDTASVTLNNGLIRGSVFGGGKGTDTYNDSLAYPHDANATPVYYHTNVRSITAGKVYGNTSVTINDGIVMHNVFGGGNLASVGKGNYYGYGEGVRGNEYDSLLMFNSGVCTVAINGGTIGTNGYLDEEGIANGNVFGSSRGLTYVNININPRFRYSRDFFLGYSNKTFVTIGNGTSNPTVYGSVFGGGENGHVRLSTDVTVNSGTIGVPYDPTLGEPVTADIWKYRGNVYGAGRGIDTIAIYTPGDPAQYCSSAGSVTRYTHVTVNGGTIHRNVYGGGSLATVGPPPVPTYLVLDPSLCTVDIKSGTIGVADDVNNYQYGGNVFGASRGECAAPDVEFDKMATVKAAVVNIGVKDSNSGPTVLGSVFGGSENGHVNDSTTVMVYSGNVGTAGTEYRGNVYGGGSGIDTYDNNGTATHNLLAGNVKGHTRVFIEGGFTYGNVYAGGNSSFVEQERVVTVDNGTVKGDVFGGSNHGLPDTMFVSLKTVNLRGGHIEGNVFGGSRSAEEGNNWQQWTAFVNITGGQVDQNVYAANKGGSVDGSVCLMMGLTAIKNAPTYVNPMAQVLEQANTFYNVGLAENTDPTIKKTKIGGSLYGGSKYYQSYTNLPQWGKYDLTGYSALFVDGSGYDTEHDEAHATTPGVPYMNIGQGIYGSGEYCESGKKSREVCIRAYGKRTMVGDTVVGATRALTTIQRGGLVLLDSANIHFTGARDITQGAVGDFAMLKVDNSLYVANGSSLVLGTKTNPVFMDSIKQVKSLYLKEGQLSYNQMGAGNNRNWYVVGVKDNNLIDTCLYLIDTVGGSPVVAPSHTAALTRAQENVILFQGPSKLWVRYHDKKAGDAAAKQYYGELLGFFRMRGDSYQPHGTESFAYARPKVSGAGTTEDNTSDGGFLSYMRDYNFFTDAGTDYTNTLQHPYTNVFLMSKGDRVDYREWIIPENNGDKWYVDGTRNWGRDDKSKNEGWGLFPDKPKKTIFGEVTYNAESNPNGNFGGIVTDTVNLSSPSLLYAFDSAIIYVVGALSASDEGALLHSSEADDQEHPLKLYRYPGGHPLSNSELDYGTGKNPTYANNNMGVGDTINPGTHAGPGPNYGAMLKVQEGANLTLVNDWFDGLYGYNSEDSLLHKIPVNLPEGAENFHPEKVSEPLVVAEGGTLTLKGVGGTQDQKGNTILRRGYNNTDANVWYIDSDYEPTGDVHHGGAMFVGKNATVNVEGFVTVMDNKQKRQITSDEASIIDCNVYLPTFDKSLFITGESNLDKDTRIGVTSPKRNDSTSYLVNTLSPVAKATSKTVAENAWRQNNFVDEQDWFFYNGSTPTDVSTTYYEPESTTKSSDGKSLYFGWTWANVVRCNPGTGSYVEQDNNITIKDAKGLAWLISKSAGMNGQTATDFKNVTIEQTADIDLLKYVWVPIGDSIPGSTERKPFAGSYDGRGHLIENLSIEYIGIGDYRYERNNYGMFGYIHNGSVNRTFVVSGTIKPASTAQLNIGGLVGCMDGSTVANSEAAVDIYCPNSTGVTIGGLVAKMSNAKSKIHSSMAMPDMHEIRQTSSGTIGGLVGNASAGKIQNSFVNARFRVDSDATGVRMGGLLGTNASAKMENCYVALHDATTNLTTSNFGSIAASNGSSNNIDSCYVMQTDTAYNYVISGNNNVHVSCGKYTPISGADMLGYMYADNKVASGNTGTKNDTALFMMLNRWVDRHGSEYAQWARPALAYNDTTSTGSLELKTPINGDLPVPMLCNYGNADGGLIGQGDFRSVGTYAGGYALQYGGPVRDNAENVVSYASPELDGAFARSEGNSLFIYGDVINAPTVAVAADKVSIYEHASIKSAGSLANYDSTYVGITFDNSYRHGYSTPTINYGLLGYGGYLLPRDWHMFSSPLRNAPLGFDYQGHNTNTFVEDGPSHSDEYHYNNPWQYLTYDGEFSWLQGNSYNYSISFTRYWMYGWKNSLSPQTGSVNMRTWKDGYFPSDSKTFGEGWISGSDEYNRYPYGMDLYTWNEPEYHWINFKRNGPNHWHSDEPHVNLKYVPAARPVGMTQYPVNQNEDSLIVGRGYMAAIATETFLQSHGTLNSGDQSIMLTSKGKNLTGWNLVGNPYHGYLDFEKLATYVDEQGNHNNSLAFYTDDDNPAQFYVVYDADSSNVNVQGSGFLYYPIQGSQNGAYAGRYLHPHQGFYMKAKGDSAMLYFDESMIVPRSELGTGGVFDGHFRGDDWRPKYPLVNLFLSSDHGCNDITVVELDRPEWGGALKMKDLRVGNGVFYARHDETNYAALFAQKGVDRIPLWFDPHEDDIYTIKWNTANAIFHSMYLIDNIAGVQYDMLLNDSYTFEGHTEDYPARFYIVFKLTDIEENVDVTHHPFAFFDGSQWMVTGDGDLQFIDLLGRVLAEKHVSGQTRISLPEVACGTYLFRLLNDKETKIQKIIINRK